MYAEKLWSEKAAYGLNTQVLYYTMPQPRGCKHIMNYNNNNNPTKNKTGNIVDVSGGGHVWVFVLDGGEEEAKVDKKEDWGDG